MTTPTPAIARWTRAASLALAWTTATAAAVLAQAPKPPAPAGEDDFPAILNYFLMLIIAGAVVGASLFPAKRGHQD